MDSKHAAIKYFENLYQIIDLGSSKGTFVNDVEILQFEWIDLNNTKNLRFGNLKVKFNKNQRLNDDSGLCNNHNSSSAKDISIENNSFDKVTIFLFLQILNIIFLIIYFNFSLQNLVLHYSQPKKLKDFLFHALRESYLNQQMIYFLMTMKMRILQFQRHNKTNTSHFPQMGIILMNWMTSHNQYLNV